MKKVKKKITEDISLFKYCKFPKNKHWDDIILTTKFSKFHKLNDPFEGFLRTRDEDGNVIHHIDPATFVASFSKVKPFKKVAVDNGKISRNVYMWSHYGDALAGICLEYNVSSSTSGFENGQVRYQLSPDGMVTAFDKYKSWLFEREFRFTYIDKKTRKTIVYVENKQMGLDLKAIYIGVRALGKNKRLYGNEVVSKARELAFVKHIKANYPEIKLYVCVRHRKSFKIIKKKEEL